MPLDEDDDVIVYVILLLLLLLLRFLRAVEIEGSVFAAVRRQKRRLPRNLIDAYRRR